MKQFTELAESGYYDNTYVFSVEDGVYFEAGSPNPDGSLNSADGDTYERVERETSGDLWPFRGAFCVPTTAQEGNLWDRITGKMTTYCGTRFVVCNSIVFDESAKTNWNRFRKTPRRSTRRFWKTAACRTIPSR